MLRHRQLYIFIFFMFLSVNSFATEKVAMISRLEFVPGMLEMVKSVIEAQIEKKVALQYIFKSDDTSLVSLNQDCKLLLIEKGYPAEKLPKEFHKTDKTISLIWVLAVQNEAVEIIKLNPEISFSNFENSLKKLKQANKFRYPWFDSLASPNSLINFHLIFDKLNSSSKKVALFLNRALEQGILNPLSVEADRFLSFKVFAAGDSLATTMWIPEDWFWNKDLRNAAFKAVEFIPFPASSGKSIIPRIKFNLWKADGADLKFQQNKFLDFQFSDKIEISDRDFLVDIKWLKKDFADLYDRLIMGEF